MGARGGGEEHQKGAWWCDSARLPARDHGPAEGHGKHTLFPFPEVPCQPPVILQRLQNPAAAELAKLLETT